MGKSLILKILSILKMFLIFACCQQRCINFNAPANFVDSGSRQRPSSKPDAPDDFVWFTVY